MNVSLNKDSDVPLRQQLADQIVFLITTGELNAGDEMPSVRALSRRVNVHHNTVSKAYQELVQREWLDRKHGSRLVVGKRAFKAQKGTIGIDEFINETIQRAKGLGYSPQALRARVRERLSEGPPDRLLVVEHEAGLREIMRYELRKKVDWQIDCCSFADIAADPSVAHGAQVLAPAYLTAGLNSFFPANRACFSIEYSNASAHTALIRELQESSSIAAASISESLLKTARSLFAHSIGRKHTYQDFLLPDHKPVDMRWADVVFCDSIAFSLVSSKRKVLYPLISDACMEELESLLSTEK